MRVRAMVVAMVGLLAACGGAGIRASSQGTPCEQVIPECHAERLLDMTLTGSETSGALGSVDGFDLNGVISFDEALRRGWTEAHFEDAKTVHVILGSADATKLGWGQGKGLFYAIDWAGVCVQPISVPSRLPGSSTVPLPSCAATTWGTVLDAKTGAFIVEGTG